MTHNTIRARLAFSFKAEAYQLDATIDLDRYSGEIGEAPNFHLLLAKAGGIDPYSYLYDALESHDIEFSEATGSAALSCRDGRFDWPQFELHRQDDQDMQVVSAIAERTLGVRDLEQRADLKAALLAAYRAGQGAV
ncbi:MAG: hypothetical protein Q8O79_03105 [Pseudomonadota bacterium]|nr:hypothetical protein [Pseudomonadota bacterium]